MGKKPIAGGIFLTLFYRKKHFCHNLVFVVKKKTSAFVCYQLLGSRVFFKKHMFLYKRYIILFLLG